MIFNTFAYFFFSSSRRPLRPGSERAGAALGLRGFGRGIFCVFLGHATGGLNRCRLPAASLSGRRSSAVLTGRVRHGAWLGVAVSLSVAGRLQILEFPHGSGRRSVRRQPVSCGRGAFLPLGISFFTFEFIHYAVDRYKGRAERGSSASTSPSFSSSRRWWPVRSSGSRISRPACANPSRHWPTDWNRGVTRILVGPGEKIRRR